MHSKAPEGMHVDVGGGVLGSTQQAQVGVSRELWVDAALREEGERGTVGGGRQDDNGIICVLQKPAITRRKPTCMQTSVAPRSQASAVRRATSCKDSR